MKDQLNRDIQITEIPKRIVSLVPSQTELLYDLGLETSIVGITKFCVHPNHFLKSKTVVGGTKQIKLEKIKALQPDIILRNKEENTEEIVRACENISVVHVSDIRTIQDCIDMIYQYGEIFEKQEDASKISEAIQINLNAFNLFITGKPVMNVAYFIWKNPWMVAGKNTFINYLLELNRYKNPYKNLGRYPELNMKLDDSIDLVLLSSEPYPFKENHIEELQKYYTKAHIQLVDGEMFSWYGSRLIQAFSYFKSLRLNL